MSDVLVPEHPRDLADRRRLTDVRQKLVAEPLPLRGSAHIPGDVPDLTGGAPAPPGAPRPMPAMSTNPTVAATTLAESKISASLVSRGSGTPTTPTFGSM